MIFSAPLVRALLDGHKTQTRRVMNVQPISYVQRTSVHPEKHEKPYLDAYCGEKKTSLNPRGMSRDWCWWTTDNRCGPFIERAPCAPGDLVWVRETWRGLVKINSPWEHYEEGVARYVPSKTECKGIEFLASNEGSDEPWRPSTQMPRWASRLTLRVTDVRAQRLQDISREDAISEGAVMRPACNGCMSRYDGWSMDWSTVGAPSKFGVNGILTEQCISMGDPQGAFFSYWSDIYGQQSYDRNPWVWAISFDVIRRNVDEVAA